MASMTLRQNRRVLLASGLALAGAVAGARATRPDPLGHDRREPAIATPDATPELGAFEIAIDAVKNLRFSPDTITVPANTPVRLVLTNRSKTYHDLVLQGLGRRIERLGPGEVGDLLIRLAPGSYTFYCSIQSHHQAGMDGTITAE